MFIAALSTIAKLPKCPSTDDCIKRNLIHTHTHTHTLEYYSAIKKNEILPSVTWMDLENLMLSEISQTEKDKYHMISLICGI